MIKVKADGSYSFTADAAVSGTGSAAATYTVTDGDGDTATAPIAFTIVDANVPTAGATQASVDDDALAGGNPASTPRDPPDPARHGSNDKAPFREIGRASVRARACKSRLILGDSLPYKKK